MGTTSNNPSFMDKNQSNTTEEMKRLESHSYCDDTSEDSEYDLEQELACLYFKEGEKNDHFERNYFRKDEKNNLIYVNDDVMKKQRGVLGHMIKSMGLNLVSGKSLIDISLPVKIFEKASFIEKAITFGRYAPIFFEKAASIPQNSFE